MWNAMSTAQLPSRGALRSSTMTMPVTGPGHSRLKSLDHASNVQCPSRRKHSCCPSAGLEFFHLFHTFLGPTVHLVMMLSNFTSISSSIVLVQMSLSSNNAHVHVNARMRVLMKDNE